VVPALLARDRLGIKPLYYAQIGDELLFGSEVKAILAGLTTRPAFNAAVLPEFLASRFVAGEETFFQGVKKLAPGFTLSWSAADGFSSRRYWRVSDTEPDASLSFQEAAAQMRTGLLDAVRSHLMSDVPLGLFSRGASIRALWPPWPPR
jgi:asparagine synthase (glutamine-hydrolysing)